LLNQFLRMVMPLGRAMFGKILKRIIAGQFAQQDFALVAVWNCLDDASANFSQFFHKLAVAFREDFLQFLSQVAGISRAVSFGADSNLQISAFDDCRDKEIAQFGLICHVAENLQLLAIFVNPAIELCQIGGSNYQDSGHEKVFVVAAENDFCVQLKKNFLNFRQNLFSNNGDASSRLGKPLDFTKGYRSGTDNYRPPAGHLKKNRVFGHISIIPSVSPKQQHFLKRKMEVWIVFQNWDFFVEKFRPLQ